jgi:hypothetical protein
VQIEEVISRFLGSTQIVPYETNLPTGRSGAVAIQFGGSLRLRVLESETWETEGDSPWKPQQDFA